MSVNVQTAEGLKKVSGGTSGSTAVTSDAVVKALGYTPAKNTDLTDHTGDTNSHVTADEKNTWNGKADAGHNHDDSYAAKTHTHPEYAAKEHEHNGTTKSKNYSLSGTDLTTSWEGCSYGFSHVDSFGGLTNSNKSDKTFSYLKMTFVMPEDGTLTISFTQSSEKNFDYGWISNLDMDLPKDYETTTVDSTVAYNAKGLDGSASYTYSNVTKGQHYITLRYRKDSSSSSGTDSFTITSLVANYIVGAYVTEQRVLELISAYMSENYENGDEGSY